MAKALADHVAAPSAGAEGGPKIGLPEQVLRFIVAHKELGFSAEDQAKFLSGDYIKDFRAIDASFSEWTGNLSVQLYKIARDGASSCIKPLAQRLTRIYQLVNEHFPACRLVPLQAQKPSH